MEQPAFLTGQFLLATPGIGDPRFDRAVIAMCAHDAEGAIGIGLGTTIEGLGLHELLDQLEIPRGDAPDVAVHIGGPVEPGRGFVIHSRDWGGQGTIDVAGRWSFTGTIDILRAIAEGRGPSRWLVALGYAGWGAGQLDGELARPGWLNVPGDVGLLYDTVAEDRWAAGFAAAGVDPRLLVGIRGMRESGTCMGYPPPPGGGGAEGDGGGGMRPLSILSRRSAESTHLMCFAIDFDHQLRAAAKPRRRSALWRRRPVEAIGRAFGRLSGATRSRLRLDI